MDKSKGQLILLFFIAFCLITLTICTLVMMFQIDIISGIIGIVISIGMSFIMYLSLKKPNKKLINNIMKDIDNRMNDLKEFDK